MRQAFLLMSVMLSAAVLTFAQLPPLIDRDLFFGDPEISGAQISPDGRFVSFLKPFKGVRNIWVKERTESFDKAHPVTADTTRPILSYFWSRDGKYVLYVQDKGGDENYRIYAVDPKGAGEPVPQARDLTPMEKVRAEIIDVPRNTPGQIIIGVNDRRADLHDVYRLNLVTGERQLLRKNDQNVIGWTTDLQGNLRLAMRMTSDGGTEILRVDPDTLMPIYAVGPEETCTPIRFTPDGKKFYLETNKARDKTELELFDPATSRSTIVDRDPLNEVDFSSALFSDVTDELLATFYIGDRLRVYPKQKQFAASWEQLKKALPAGEINIGNMTADENVWVVAVSSDVDPGSRYLFDRRSGKTELLYRSRPNLPSEQLASVKPVRYKARDGMTIPAYLTTPKGIPATNLPTVMLIHGGPWGRVTWGYNPEAQFFANRGYAVLQMNFRGSTGYGKRFLNAGNKQWGIGFMQHDISDGVKYLIAQKIAAPRKVGIYGGSYGGYATLAGLAFTPELYAAGISYVGPSNILTLLKSIPPYWAPMKKVFALRVGDMEDAKDRAMLEKQSPLNSARDIRAPLLVIQGANDPRVNKAESDQIVAAVRDLGRPVEYLVAPDEGHGFAGKLNRLAAYAAMEKFFAKYLGGRYQESMTPEVKQKLEQLTVDVNTVKVQQKSSSDAGALTPPAFDPSLVRPDTLKYASKYTMMGRELMVNTTRVVSPAQYNNAKVWRVVDAVSSPMGQGTDTLDINATTLLPVRQSGKQGPGSIALSFTPDSITGKITAGAMNMPVNVKLNGLTLPDGAGLEIPLATIPLKEGYKAGVQIFEAMGGKTHPMAITVAAAEQVTTPAGAFDTYRIDLTSADDPNSGQKFWITKADRRLVKSEAHLPASMGGGVVTSELTK